MSVNALGNAVIKTEPAVLKNQALEVERLAEIINNAFIQARSAIDETQLHWIGDAGDLHRELYRKRIGEIDEALQRLRDHPVNLMIIAGVYEDAEKDNESDANSLPETIIG